jgi:flagellar basal-body rod protein FlgC
MRISSSGLNAERFRMDTISGNIANANTTSIKGGAQPYRRKVAEIQGDENGVHIVGVTEDQSPFSEKVDPNDPNADANGKVLSSNVKPVAEMVDMLSASRAYEANVAAFNTTKQMIQEALSIGKA